MFVILLYVNYLYLLISYFSISCFAYKIKTQKIDATFYLSLIRIQTTMKSNTHPRIECRVCYDAGKSEREYNNHRVKDRNGKVTCPTLMHTECRNCKKKGHTIKYCLQVMEKPMAPQPVLQKPIYQSAEHERKVLFPPLSAKAPATKPKTWTTSFADTLLRETPKEEPTKKESSLPQGWTMLYRITAEEAAEIREFESRKRKCEDYLRSDRPANEYDDEVRAEWQLEYEAEFGIPDDDTVYFQEDIDNDFDDDF